MIEGVCLGQPQRVGRILEVRAADGSPPYLVRWVRPGYTTLIVPGPDARVVQPSQPGNGAGQRGRTRLWHRMLARWKSQSEE